MKGIIGEQGPVREKDRCFGNMCERMWGRLETFSQETVLNRDQGGGAGAGVGSWAQLGTKPRWQREQHPPRLSRAERGIPGRAQDGVSSAGRVAQTLRFPKVVRPAPQLAPVR